MQAQTVVDEIEKYPRLKEIVDDATTLSDHQEIIDLMMTAVYPSSQHSSLISAASAPFRFDIFFSTPLYKKIFDNDDPEKQPVIKMDENIHFKGKMLKAYASILETFYGKKINLTDNMLLEVMDVKTEIKRFFKLDVVKGFIDIKPKGELPKLTNKDFELLFQNITDLNVWKKLIPPEKFVFTGFIAYSFHNVTDLELTSLLKHDLLERESIINEERFKLIQDKVKSLFRLPCLQLGLVAFPSVENEDAAFNSAIGVGNSFMKNDNCELSCNDYRGSVYETAMINKEPTILQDLTIIEKPTIVESELLKQGIKSLIIVPLYYEDEPIGMMEIGSPNAEAFCTTDLFKIKNIQSLFSIAVQRSIEEQDNRIQAVIKEKCTAIHPTVEWKFRQEAISLLSKEGSSESKEMEPIVFDNVYPLYGLTDIRNSSTFRNEAIQSDLIEHLTLVRDIVDFSRNVKDLPIMEELVFRINRYMEQIKNGISSGDEVNVIDFIKNEVEPSFVHLSTLSPDLKGLIKAYEANLEPNLGVYYNKRKDFEDSVGKINTLISSFLEEAQSEAQKMFPHYFEKYKTDGVEHSIYIGGALTNTEDYNPLYLRNLRLWQLMVVCGIVRHLHDYKSDLKIGLETAHLILVQNTPLSIRFRFDEKKFDVDGTYNIRYEIMKKRIDKAIIRGKKERLTQPGKIAIIYSQIKEANEYKKYIEYLQHKKYLLSEVEDLELEDLQGMQGLKALRVEVDQSSVILKKDIEEQEIKKAVNLISDFMN